MKNKKKISIKRTSQVKKKRLIEYFQKSGYDVNINKFEKRLFHISMLLTFIFWLVIFIMVTVNNRSPLDLLYYSIAHWTVIFVFIWLLLRALVYFWLEFRIYNRTKQVEEVLPDFLQLTSANISAGMPIDRALWFAIRPHFGVLAKEIEDVAKETLSGEDLADSLKKFVGRYDSVLLKRSIALLLEGLDAGGELADLLNKIALNLQELKIMKKEMAASVTTYAIFITFASIVIAPILFALSSQLVQIIITIVGSLDLGGGGMMASFSPSTDVAIVGRFRTYSLLMLGVTGMMSAAIIGVIKKGRVKEAVKDMPIYIAVALIIFWLAYKGLGVMFAGFF